MISRVASHCFWLGRYVERAESAARVLLVTRNLALDGDLAPRQVWGPVIVVSGEEARFRARFGDAAMQDSARVQDYLTWDEENAVSLRRSVSAARDNARWIREVLSLEIWECLNELHLWLGSPAAREEWEADRHAFFRRVRQAMQTVTGVMKATMLDDDALAFVTMGLMLERAGQTARILDVHHHALLAASANEVIETSVALALLRACSGFEPFMKRHQGLVTPVAIARFLVLEPAFPRSIAYCLRVAHARLERIRTPGAQERPGGQELPGARALARLARLEAEVAARGATLAEGDVHALLTRVVDEGSGICDLIGEELLGAAPAAPPTAVPQ